MKQNDKRLTNLAVRVSPAMKEQLLDRARLRARCVHRRVTPSEVARDLLELALELTKIPDALSDAAVGRRHASGAKQTIARPIDEAFHREGPIAGLHEQKQRAFAGAPEARNLERNALTGGSQWRLGLLTGVVALLFGELLQRDRKDLPLGAFDQGVDEQPDDASAEAKSAASARPSERERAAPMDRASTDVNGPDWLRTAPWLGG